MIKFSLMYLLNFAKKRILILIAVVAVLLSIALGYFKFSTTSAYSEKKTVPVYLARASVLVTNGATFLNNDNEDSQSASSNGIMDLVDLTNSVVEILKTPDIYKSLASKVGGYSYQQLMSISSVNSRGEDTSFVDVTFTSSTPEEAKKLVNAFVELAPEYISDCIPYAHLKYYTTESAEKTYSVTGRMNIVF